MSSIKADSNYVQWNDLIDSSYANFLDSLEKNEEKWKKSVRIACASDKTEIEYKSPALPLTELI
jgi:hypothetical protein